MTETKETDKEADPNKVVLCSLFRGHMKFRHGFGRFWHQCSPVQQDRVVQPASWGGGCLKLIV